MEIFFIFPLQLVVQLPACARGGVLEHLVVYVAHGLQASGGGQATLLPLRPRRHLHSHDKEQGRLR